MTRYFLILSALLLCAPLSVNAQTPAPLQPQTLGQIKNGAAVQPAPQAAPPAQTDLQSPAQTSLQSPVQPQPTPAQPATQEATAPAGPPGPLPKLAFPLACTLGQNCWISRYPDTDPAKDSAKDYTCAARTEDGHEGVDFAVQSFADVERGVDVLAAADGKVLRVRDGEIDGPKTQHDFEGMKAQSRECGNGVIIDHGQGAVTFYCHLKNGSIEVKAEDQVKQGQKIAQVGQSGLSEYPHLHLTVISNKNHIDPFTSQPKDAGCGKPANPLWTTPISYQPFAIFDAGFTEYKPSFAQIETGADRPVGFNSKSVEDDPAFVFWMGYYGAAEGDEIYMTITRPDGSVYADRQTLQAQPKARQYYYVGKTRIDPLPPGIYTGKVTIHRQGVPDQSLERSIEVTP